MKRIWPLIYAAGAVICICGGFLGPRQIPLQPDIDWLMITMAFIMMSVTPLGVFAYGIHHSKKTGMERPSLDRHFFGWWTDTLQPLRVTVIVTALHTLGALTASFFDNAQPRMLLYFYVAASIGCFIGERLVYRVYKAKITLHSGAGAQPPLFQKN